MLHIKRIQNEKCQKGEFIHNWHLLELLNIHKCQNLGKFVFFECDCRLILYAKFHANISDLVELDFICIEQKYLDA
jgi:hypothetical protein